MATVITNGIVQLTLQNQAWIAEKSGDLDWRLHATIQDWKLQLYLYNSFQISEQEFFTNSASPAIKQGRSAELKPHEDVMEIGRGKRILFQELRKVEGVFATDVNNILYVALLVKSGDDASNVYGYASLSFPFQEMPNWQTYFEEIVAVLCSTEFITNQPISSQNSSASDLELAAWFHDSSWRCEEYYNSGSYAGGGGYSTEYRFDFYSNGTFRYNYNKIVSMNSYGGISLGGGVTEEKDHGVWYIKDRVLYANFSDGTNATYDVTVGSGKCHLNDKGYIRYNL